MLIIVVILKRYHCLSKFKKVFKIYNALFNNNINERKRANSKYRIRINLKLIKLQEIIFGYASKVKYE